MKRIVLRALPMLLVFVLIVTMSNGTVLEIIAGASYTDIPGGGGGTTYTVTLTGGANATRSGGAASQTGLTGAMTPVTYRANSGYIFPETSDLYKTTNGITVARTSDTVVTVSGTPTANATITVPDATAIPTVTYKPGEGTGEEGKFNAIPNGQGGFKHVIEKYEDNFIAPEGKRFDHWDDGRGNEYRYGEEINPVTEDITLTAIWVDNSQGGGSRGGLSTNGADVVFNIPGADGGWEYIGGGVPQRTYRLSLAPMQGGSAYFLLNSGENGETMNVYPQTTVRVVPTPAPGYRLASIVWSMIDGSASYDITESQTFVMPAMDAVVYVTFQSVA